MPARLSHSHVVSLASLPRFFYTSISFSQRDKRERILGLGSKMASNEPPGDAADKGSNKAADRGFDKGIYLVDPLGHVMMRFPDDPDPSRMKKDLGKLLKWSRVG